MSPRWPIHPTIPRGHRSRAPYNFVPLPEGIFIPGEPFAGHDELEPEPERLHGQIVLAITTETPLYTRAAHDPADVADPRDSDSKQCFFHHGDERRPVIPGSSLRGMTRSLVEILSYSRIGRRATGGGRGRLRDEKLIYRAVAEQQTSPGTAYNDGFIGRGIMVRGMRHLPFPSDRVKAGYLRHNGSRYEIQPAQELAPPAPPDCPPLPRSFIRVDGAAGGGALEIVATNTMQAWVQLPTAPANSLKPPANPRFNIRYWKAGTVVTTAPTAPAGWCPGLLVASGPTPPGGRHMHTFVFEADRVARCIAVPDVIWEQFDFDQRLTRGLPCRTVNVGDPVFYLVDGAGQLIFLGPTLFFRCPYPHATADFVPQSTMTGQLDLAEALFGTVNDGHRTLANATTEEGAHRGRVFFDDAPWDGEGGDPFLDPRAAVPRYPDILSSPKPTSYQNYLVQDQDWAHIGAYRRRHPRPQEEPGRV